MFIFCENMRFGYTVIMFIFCENLGKIGHYQSQSLITNSNHPLCWLYIYYFRNNLKNMVYTQAILLQPICYITKNCQSEKLVEKTGNNLVLNRPNQQEHEHFWNILCKSSGNLIQNPMPLRSSKNFRIHPKIWILGNLVLRSGQKSRNYMKELLEMIRSLQLLIWNDIVNPRKNWSSG